jgi:serine O-acetyltransferase
VIHSKADLRAHIAADFHAHGLNRWRPQYRITQRIATFQWLLRRSEYWSNCRRDPLGRVLAAWLAFRTKRLGERMGFSIPRNVFGPGLRLAHVGTIVVNTRTRAGARCTLHQGVTLGAGPDGQAPTLGDDVHVSPNACIIGALTVGDHASAWAGAVVTKDVEAYTSVAGVPARVVERRAPSPKPLGDASS